MRDGRVVSRTERASPFAPSPRAVLDAREDVGMDTPTVGAATGTKVRPPSSSPAREILRDITRGGLAGLVVGILLAGVVGRVVMRLAAVLVPGSAGGVTENGNVIGTITLGGTMGIVVGIGLLFGAVAGSIWVTIRPWLPASRARRAVLAIPIAIGLGAPALVQARNPDFAILQHNALIIGLLVVLVALFGPALVVAEGWLDRRLPHPQPRDTGATTGYVVVTVLGLLLTFLIIVPMYLGTSMVLAGIALVAVGIATVASWALRMRGLPTPQWLYLAARACLGVATVAGLAIATSEVAGAAGLR